MFCVRGMIAHNVYDMFGSDVCGVCICHRIVVCCFVCPNETVCEFVCAAGVHTGVDCVEYRGAVR